MIDVSDTLFAIRWWAVLMLMGITAVPLTTYLFNRLPDRGYAFTKLVGLLIVSYLFWLLGSLGFLNNDLGGIFVVLFLLLALSVWAYRAQEPLWPWLKQNRSKILITELLFGILFFAWVWVRAQHPSIAATEKPMEFAFLNSIGRSPNFPPLDPWLSGFAISYYYFGYVMTSVIARLAFVPEAIAFNLGIAWLVAGSGTAAFGLVYNLIAGQSIAERGVRRFAVLLGLIAAIALPIAGNLQIGMEIAYANDLGSANFWQWLNVRDINGDPAESVSARYEGSGWWWWRSSRVIHEHHLSGRAEEGLEPIVEFPGFSFILGDMHPHVLALPFAFLSLAVALAWWLRPRNAQLSPKQWQTLSWRSRLNALFDWPLWAFTVLVLGGLSFLNTWDVLIHLFVVVGAIFLTLWLTHGWHRHLTSQFIMVSLCLVIPAILFYLPFYIGFRSQAGAPYILPMLMRPTRLPHFLIIFGMPLMSIVLLMLSLGIKQRFRQWRVGVITAVSLIVGLLLLMFFLGWLIASSSENWRVLNLANELSVLLEAPPAEGMAVGWGFTAVARLMPAILTARLAYPGVTLLLATILSLAVMVWVEQANSRSPIVKPTLPVATTSTLPFALLLIVTGALLTLGPEFLYLRDNFGVRLNTIFKFYYQAWVVFGIAALYGLYYLWHHIRQSQWVTPALATVGYGTAFVVASLFPLYAVQSRAQEYRGAASNPNRPPPTLDGLAYVERFNPDEYDAVNWLRENVADTAVILEAIGGQYSDFGRISARTGLPTLLGWAGHQYQWRGSDHPEPGPRDAAVQQIYGPLDWNTTTQLLNQYDVEYIYVGNLERNTYGQNSSEKFQERLEIAYENNSVTIYRWHPQ